MGQFSFTSIKEAESLVPGTAGIEESVPLVFVCMMVPTALYDLKMFSDSCLNQGPSMLPCYTPASTSQLCPFWLLVSGLLLPKGLTIMGQANTIMGNQEGLVNPPDSCPRPVSCLPPLLSSLHATQWATSDHQDWQTNCFCFTSTLSVVFIVQQQQY